MKCPRDSSVRGRHKSLQFREDTAENIPARQLINFFVVELASIGDDKAVKRQSWVEMGKLTGRIALFQGLGRSSNASHLTEEMKINPAQNPAHHSVHFN